MGGRLKNSGRKRKSMNASTKGQPKPSSVQVIPLAKKKGTFKKESVCTAEESIWGVRFKEMEKRGRSRTPYTKRVWGCCKKRPQKGEE